MKQHVLFKTASFHALFTLKKEEKSTKRCRFERHCASFSLGHAQAREEEVFLPCNASLPLSPHFHKPWHNPYPLMAYNHNEKRGESCPTSNSRVAAPCHPSHLTLSHEWPEVRPPMPWLDRVRWFSPPPLINTRGGLEEKGMKKERERERK